MKFKVVLFILISLSFVFSACQPQQRTQTNTDTENPVVEPTAQTQAEPITLVFWCHWAQEDNKKAVLNAAIDKFESTHPNVKVEVTWWNKTEMFPAMRNAFTAREGFPDIFYFDRGALEFIDAGWLEDLANAIEWSEVKDDAKIGWTRPGPDGENGVWAVALETATDEIYYNKDIFDKLGIEVPDNYQFTADEFYDVVKKIKAAGYDPFANGINGSTFVGHYLYTYSLLAKLGGEDLTKLWLGQKSWKDPDVVEALTYAKKMIDVPIYPATYSTMKLDESHVYFHTEQKAAMFLVGSWYTGRAFVPPDNGGQPADFRLGMLHYPAMPNGLGNDLMESLVSGSIAVAEASPHRDLANELLQVIASTETGNLWVEQTAGQTGMKTTALGGPFQDYFNEYNKVHQGVKYASTYYQMIMPAAMKDVFDNVLCQGLPLGQITLEEAIEKLEEARLILPE